MLTYGPELRSLLLELQSLDKEIVKHGTETGLPEASLSPLRTTITKFYLRGFLRRHMGVKLFDEDVERVRVQARLASVYYNTLVSCGFTDAEALALTQGVDLFSHMLSAGGDDKIEVIEED